MVFCVVLKFSLKMKALILGTSSKTVWFPQAKSTGEIFPNVLKKCVGLFVGIVRVKFHKIFYCQKRRDPIQICPVQFSRKVVQIILTFSNFAWLIQSLF